MADHSVSHYIRGFPLPQIPPACPADSSASHYLSGWLFPNPAGLPGGSFGFPLPPRLPTTTNPAGQARRIVRLPTTSAASHYHKSRRLARRILRLPTTSPASHYPKSRRMASGGSFGFPLHPRLPTTPNPAGFAPADSSASHYLSGWPSPKLPPDKPGGSRLVSHYLRGFPLPQIPADKPGGSFGFRLPPQLALATNPAGSPGGSFGFPLPPRLAFTTNPAGSPGGSFGFRLLPPCGLSKSAASVRRKGGRESVCPPTRPAIRRRPGGPRSPCRSGRAAGPPGGPA